MITGLSELPLSAAERNSLQVGHPGCYNHAFSLEALARIGAGASCMLINRIAWFLPTNRTGTQGELGNASDHVKALWMALSTFEGHCSTFKLNRMTEGLMGTREEETLVAIGYRSLSAPAAGALYEVTDRLPEQPQFVGIIAMRGGSPAVGAVDLADGTVTPFELPAPALFR